MPLGSRVLAKTTARVGAARMGTARMGFIPRNTTDHVPGTVATDVARKKRYYVWGRVYSMPEVDPNVTVLS